MSGVEIIGALLAAYAPIFDFRPAVTMKGGRLPQGTPLPAIVVTRVSRTGAARLSGPSSLYGERVQVSVHAANYQQQVDLLKIVCRALDGFVGAAAGFNGVTITDAGAGPDFSEDAQSEWIGSQDFRVSYPNV